MEQNDKIFDLLLVLADGNIANLYNVAHQYSTLHPRGKPLTVSVLRREKAGVLFPDKPDSGSCFIIRMIYQKIILDIRLLPLLGFAEALMCDYPGLGHEPILAYSLLTDRNDRMAKRASIVLKTNLTLFIRRGHRFTDRPRFYSELENPTTSIRQTAAQRMTKTISELWPKSFKIKEKPCYD